MEYKKLYSLLVRLKGISPVWGHVLQMLSDMMGEQKNEPLLKGLCIYFALLDEGNTCMTLDADALTAKWNKKWQGLLTQAKLQGDENAERRTECGVPTDEEMAAMLKEGIGNLLKDTTFVAKAKGSEPIGTTKPLVRAEMGDKARLFATKYYNAVVSVNKSLARIYNGENKKATDNEKSAIVEKIETRTGGLKLNAEQAEAVVRAGKGENLIVSGGPGMGKTTVACYVVWEILEKCEDLDNWQVVLAAPSGKAQDRLKESVVDGIGRIADDKLDEQGKKIKQKLLSAESYTIHRLLRYNPGSNAFSMNAESQFNAKTIFVIDEASMIDICMFRSLLEAIPDEARIFILGDPYQLPSVQAGAVLGDLIRDKGTGHKVELKISNRFAGTSAVGRISAKIKEMADSDAPENESMEDCKLKWQDADTFLTENQGIADVATDENGKRTYPVTGIVLNNADGNATRTQKAEMLEKMAKAWAKKFYAYECTTLEAEYANAEAETEVLDKLWATVTTAKMLCAEREGTTGVEKMNALMSKMVKEHNQMEMRGTERYAGEQLIVTQNMKMLNLYNGDCGIVVGRKDAEERVTNYLMVKKPQAKKEGEQNNTGNQHERTGIHRVGDYMFYPIYLLPTEAIEEAYAITIHKSQGSGYDHIMIFLPEAAGHPLLNNQIIYTAITRTQGNTYVVGNGEAYESGVKSRIERDTMVEMKEQAHTPQNFATAT